MNNNEKLTNYIIEQIEKSNVLPWQRGFESGGEPRNYVTGHKYQGRNLLMCLASGWSKPQFMTYIQAKKEGYQVQKGAKGIPIIWASQGGWVENDDGEKEWKGGGSRLFYVFNIAQIDGVDENRVVFGNNPDINAFMDKFPIEYEFGKSSAWIIGTNKICIPYKSEFKSEDIYYSHLLHELVHWSGMALKRESNVHNKTMYSFEELVAELGSCYLRSHFGINYQNEVENTTAYLDGWLSVFKKDTSVLLRASKEAQRAFDYLIGYNPNFCEATS